MAGRRAEIRRRFNVTQQFEELEESCLPSYCHPNPLAAYAAWWRLFAAAKLAPQTGPLLDFGAASGEFAYLQTGDYDYVEGNEVLAKALAADLPSAQRQTLNALPSAHYSTIVALDSLEHNDDSRQIIDLLVNSLRQDGSFILSGPTENFLYRIGRRLAGFNGH
jgi:2-polyprenyl-3-methyl-5-hydroxy-6-metoxy-1,4-benzoquinol methylase